MFPKNRLSLENVPDEFIKPKKDLLTDYEWGGVSLRDTTKGLYHSLWYGQVDFDVATISNDTNSFTLNLNGEVKEFSFCFDNNMNYCVAYTNMNDVSFLTFYDTYLQSYETITLDALNLNVSLDTGVPEFSAINDIILSYIKNNNLYFRLQRDRFQVEYLLKQEVGSLLNSGMMKNNRYGWEID